MNFHELINIIFIIKIIYIFNMQQQYPLQQQQQQPYQQQPYQQQQYQQQYQQQQQQQPYQQQQQRHINKINIPSYVDDPNDTSIILLRNKNMNTENKQNNEQYERQNKQKSKKIKKNKTNKIKKYKNNNVNINDDNNEINKYTINEKRLTKNKIYTLAKNSSLIFIIYFILSQNFINQGLTKIMPNIIGNETLNAQLLIGCMFVLLFIVLSLIINI